MTDGKAFPFTPPSSSSSAFSLSLFKLIFFTLTFGLLPCAIISLHVHKHSFCISSYQNGSFTDLLIKFRRTTYNVHKLVVCNQSSILDAMCSGGFKLEPPLKDRVSPPLLCSPN